MNLFLTNGLGTPVGGVQEIKKVKEIKLSTDNRADIKSKVSRGKPIKGVVK